MSFEIPVTMRLANEGDLNLIVDSWSKTLIGSMPYRAVPRKLYQQGIRVEISRLIERSTTYVLCAEDDPNQIYSFAVVEQIGGVFTIHYASTKGLFQRMGLMRRLLLQINPDFAETGGAYTAYAPALSLRKPGHAETFAEHLQSFYGFIFNPFLKGVA